MVLQVLSSSLLSLSLFLFLFLSPTLSLSMLTFLASLTLSSSLAFVGVLLPNPRQFQLDKPRQDHLVFLVEVKYSDLYRNDWYLRNLLALDQWSSQIECYFSISIEKLYYNIFTIHFYISLLKGSSFFFFIFCKYVTHHIFSYNLFVSRCIREWEWFSVAPTPLEHPSRVFSRKELVHLFLADVQGWGRSTVGECRII